MVPNLSLSFSWQQPMMNWEALMLGIWTLVVKTICQLTKKCLVSFDDSRKTKIRFLDNITIP